MSVRVQSTSEYIRTESTPKFFANPSNVPKAPVEKDKNLDKLGTEEVTKEVTKEELDRGEVESAVESINNAIEYVNRTLRFSIHEDTQRVMVKVIDLNTDEVIKELPPEDVLDTVARIREMIGLLIDERA
jgi:flagellar protein FlaG